MCQFEKNGLDEKNVKRNVKKRYFKRVIRRVEDEKSSP
jgi:hypothetical protein